MNYKEYYINQGKNQVGYGQIEPFRGIQIQTGYGLGGFFNIIKRGINWLMPIIKTHTPVLKHGAEVVGRELIKTASNIATDVIDGKNINESFKNHSKTSINTLADKLQNSLVGKGKKRKGSKSKTKKKNQHNKKFRDIFD
jgi:hypothetical protein